MEFNSTDDVIKAALLATVSLTPQVFGLAHRNLVRPFVEQFAKNVQLEPDGSLSGIGGSLSSELSRAKTDSAFEHYWAASAPTKKVIDKDKLAGMTPQEKLAYANSLTEHN